MTDTPEPQVPALTTDAGEPGSTLNLDYWQIVWRQFRRHVPAMIGLSMVLSLFLVSVVAPFLANKYPYYWRSESEGLTFPLFRSLTNLDLIILCAFALVVLVPLTRRILRRIGWSFWQLHEIRRAIAVNMLLFVLAALLLANLRAVPDRVFMDHEVTIGGTTYTVRIERDYREEIANGAEASCLFPPIRYSPSDILVGSKFEVPSRKHILGADRLGRSTAARLIYGTRVSLAVGFISVSLSVLIGVLVGGISAYFGGWVDLVLQRIVEIFMCFPRLFLILTVIALFGPKLWLIMAVIGLTGWTGTARFIRAEILKVRTLDYVTAARALGLRSVYIVIRHALPNSIAPVLVGISFGVAAAISLEVSLSFLGLGDPDFPSWGLMLKQARAVAEQHTSMLIIPGVTIFFAVLAYNLVGEGMRDAIDPRLKM